MNRIFAFVNQGQVNAFVQERQVAQTVRQNFELINGGREDFSVRLESNRSAAFRSGMQFHQRGNRVAAGKFDRIRPAVAADFHFHPFGQRVHAGHTDAVQTSGHFVVAVVELAAGVQNGQHNFHGGFVFFRVHIHRDAAAVIFDRDAVVRVNRYNDFVGISGKRFVDTVVNDFINEMMQSAFAGIADIHAGTFPDSFESFQNCDLAGGITALSGGSRRGRRGIFRRNRGFFCHIATPILGVFKTVVIFVQFIRVIYTSGFGLSMKIKVKRCLFPRKKQECAAGVPQGSGNSAERTQNLCYCLCGNRFHAEGASLGTNPFEARGARLFVKQNTPVLGQRRSSRRIR